MESSWTQADLYALDQAIKTGAKEVAYHDKRVIYRTLDEMLKIRGIIIGEINVGLGISRPKRYYASVSKGTRP